MNRKMRATCNNGYTLTKDLSSFVGSLLNIVATESLREETEKEYRRLSAMDVIDRKRAL